MKLWAISDLHMASLPNRAALERIPPLLNDWLILAGDLTDGPDLFDWCLSVLTNKFRRVVWVPGNHELWTKPGSLGAIRGAALYDKLVGIARDLGVITPEDPYAVFPHRSGQVLIAPLFLLYDYSFRPDGVSEDEVVAWAARADSVCADEYFLHPDPYPGRGAWCEARCAEAARRLDGCRPDLPKVLVSHYPLEEEIAVLPKFPRFAPWCGTHRTHGWHRRFNARAVVYGHLHLRGTRWIDGVPFQEVSLGYPSQWDRWRGIESYLREVELAPVGKSRG